MGVDVSLAGTTTVLLQAGEVDLDDGQLVSR